MNKVFLFFVATILLGSLAGCASQNASRSDAEIEDYLGRQAEEDGARVGRELAEQMPSDRADGQ